MESIDILRNISNVKNSGLKMSDTRAKETIAVVYKKINTTNKLKYINLDSHSKTFDIVVESHQYGILPHIPMLQERFIISIIGASGIGKGVLSANFMEQYMNINKQPRIFYFCSTPFTADISITSKKGIVKIIKQLPLDKEDIDSYFDNITEFSNSLCVFDDIDNNKNQKQIMKLLNMMVEVGRKFKINLIFISHKATHATQSTINNETNLYICEPDKFNNENRMITKYLDLSISDDLQLEVKNSPFVCYSKNSKYIITDKKIIKYAK